MAAQSRRSRTRRKLLEANLFHHELITAEELALRHARSIGQNFDAFVARNAAAEAAPAKEPKTPIWQRLTEVQVPLLLIFGREDRAKAAERAALLKQKHPQLNLHIVANCKHLVPWDAADEFIRLAVPVSEILKDSTRGHQNHPLRHRRRRLSRALGRPRHRLSLRQRAAPISRRSSKPTPRPRRTAPRCPSPSPSRTRTSPSTWRRAIT